MRAQRPWIPIRERRKLTERLRQRGSVTHWLQAMYADADELGWHATRRSPILAAMHGEHGNGARFAYDTELEPGALDAGSWCPYDPGGAVSYDVD